MNRNSQINLHTMNVQAFVNEGPNVPYS